MANSRIKNGGDRFSKSNYLKLTSMDPLDYKIKQIPKQMNHNGDEFEWAILDNFDKIIELGASEYSCKSKLKHMIEYMIVNQNINSDNNKPIKPQFPEGTYQHKYPCPFCRSLTVVNNKCISCRNIRN